MFVFEFGMCHCENCHVPKVDLWIVLNRPTDYKAMNIVVKISTHNVMDEHRYLENDVRKLA